MKLIDAHAHVVQCIAGTGSQGELRPCGGGRAAYATGQAFQILPPEFGEYAAPPEALLRVMDDPGAVPLRRGGGLCRGDCVRRRGWHPGGGGGGGTGIFLRGWGTLRTSKTRRSYP